MNAYPETATIHEIIEAAERIVIVQADNPDGDSLGSALALEQILGDLGKQPYLYCGADIPSYLSYLKGWDRVQKDLPHQFDAAIIVDTSANSLLENLQKTGQRAWLAAKPVIVIDHHNVENTITYAKVVCNHTAVAAGEVMYELAQQLNWPINLVAKEMIATAIMSDSLGLTTDATTARSIAIISELVAGGVSIAELEQARRELMRKSPNLVRYKGELLQRIEYFADNRVATVTIPWEEIEKYSPEYNPSMLVIDDMRMTTGTVIAISFKLYNDGHVTAKIRANYGAPIAGKLAEHFGGGGHPYASGFKVTGSRPFNELKSECIQVATDLLDNLKREQSDETLQHTHA
ncbi:MAG TPA: DHH family phosphoesterase [Candidatus Saccharimonadales bacterium]|jgi:phosphoesterase RecJ-like protein|nr:DHH family phosphoesterase [Candidatus Saccharimonadales bacterium]